MTATSPFPARAIGIWLLACAALVFLMVLLGGLTRLTGSGLSMVDWRPLTGWLPPLGHEQWLSVYEAYRQTPEFQLVNSWMTIEDFRGIFWLEYLHRLFGRIIGVAYLLPFIWFAARHRLPGRTVFRLAIPFVLGGLQGALGWYMVKSGLVDEPSVSQYRLAAHLGLAVVIYGFLLHGGLDMLRAGCRRAGGPAGAIMLVTGMIFATMIMGAFLAGLDGGGVYNSFPLMDGHLVPPEAMTLHPWWRDIFENVATIQFAHRVLALATLGAILALWLAARRTASARPVSAMALVAACQFTLGAVAVVHGAPLSIAWAHQAGAMILFSCAVWAWQGAARRAPYRPDAAATTVLPPGGAAGGARK